MSDDRRVDTTLAAGGPPSEKRLQPGETVGRYVIKGVLGSGGMSVVYDAEDPQLGRRVAVKLLKTGMRGDYQARLLREAQALARLNHPHVVAVHDVGTVGDQVFLVQELLDGGSLWEWVQVQGRTWRDVLDAYLKAGRGLAAAHEAGLVHRDFKPENVLCGTDGRLRVVDFGLVTAAGEVTVSGESLSPSEHSTPVPSRPLSVALTHDGEVMGTPLYMAPEQHRGRHIDARSDQYGFAVALYEALYKVHPFGGRNRKEIQARAKANDVAPAPAKTKVPGYVRAALLRAIRAVPDERWPTMPALLHALEGSAVRRKRAAVALAVAVLVAGGTAFGAYRLSRSHEMTACRDRRPLASVWTAERRKAIEDAFGQSKLPYAADATRVVLDVLDAWAVAYADEDRRLCEDDAGERQAADVLARRRSCMSRARSDMSELVGDLAKADPAAVRMGPSATRKLINPADCNTPAGLSHQIAPPNLGTELRASALHERFVKARTIRRLGNAAEARKICEPALAEARALAYPPIIAEGYQELGDILHGLGDPGDEQAMGEALLYAEQAHDDYRAARISVFLVEIAGAHGVDAAERQALLARAAAARVGDDPRLLASIEDGLGRTYRLDHQYAPSVEHYRKAQDIKRRIGDRDGVDFDQRNLVLSLTYQGRLNEAVPLAVELLESDEKQLGPKHPSTLQDRSSLGMIYFQQGRFADALPVFQRVTAEWEEVGGKDSIYAARSRTMIAAVLFALGRLEEALPLYAASVKELEGLSPPDDEVLRGARMNLGQTYGALGRYRESETILRPLADQARRLGDDEGLGLVLANLAETLRLDGRPAEALPICLEAIERYEKVFGPGAEKVGRLRSTLGSIYLDLGKLDEATAQYEQAIKFIVAEVGEDALRTGEARTGLARIHLARKDAAGAEPFAAKAVAVRAAGDPLDLAESRFVYAQVLLARKDRANAEAEAKGALDLYTKAGERAARQRAAVEKWLAALR